LGEILSLGHVLRHPKTQGIHAAIVTLIDLFKRFDVTFPGGNCERVI
jgi:hypothetical protein